MLVNTQKKKWNNISVVIKLYCGKKKANLKRPAPRPRPLKQARPGRLKAWIGRQTSGFVKVIYSATLCSYTRGVSPWQQVSLPLQMSSLQNPLSAPGLFLPVRPPVGTAAKSSHPQVEMCAHWDFYTGFNVLYILDQNEKLVSYAQHVPPGNLWLYEFGCCHAIGWLLFAFTRNFRFYWITLMADEFIIKWWSLSMIAWT